MTRKREDKRPRCPHCKRPLRTGQLVHKGCAAYCVVTDEGVFRQLSFLGPGGDLRPALRWQASSLMADMLRPLPKPATEPPKPLEAYIHTPGKCAKCGKRVRNKARVMHRRCLREVQDPPPPPKPQRPTVTFPTARYCVPCRSLDNSYFPSRKCRSCGLPTVEVTPETLPRPLPPKPKTPRR